MMLFALLFAPALLAAAVMLERLERQLFDGPARPEADTRTELTTVLHIAYPHIADSGGGKVGAASVGGAKLG